MAVKELLSENRGEMISRFLFEKDCVESLLGYQSSSSPDKKDKLCKKMFLFTTHEHEIGLWISLLTFNEKGINGFFAVIIAKLLHHKHLIIFNERINEEFLDL